MEPQDFIGLGWPAALFALALWMGKRELNNNSKFHESVEKRVRALETDRVTKADFNRLDGKIDALSTQMNSQHSTMMQLLLEQKRDLR